MQSRPPGYHNSPRSFEPSSSCPWTTLAVLLSRTKADKSHSVLVEESADLMQTPVTPSEPHGAVSKFNLTPELFIGCGVNNKHDLYSNSIHNYCSTYTLIIKKKKNNKKISKGACNTECNLRPSKINIIYMYGGCAWRKDLGPVCLTGDDVWMWNI